MSKISASYRDRLNELFPDVESRAIILLNSRGNHRFSHFARLSRTERRKVLVDRLSTEIEESFGEIKSLLQEYGGKLVSSSPSLLGTIVVEAPAKTIFELSKSKNVHSIIEDQTVVLNRGKEIERHLD